MQMHTGGSKEICNCIQGAPKKYATAYRGLQRNMKCIHGAQRKYATGSWVLGYKEICNCIQGAGSKEICNCIQGAPKKFEPHTWCSKEICNCILGARLQSNMQLHTGC